MKTSGEPEEDTHSALGREGRSQNKLDPSSKLEVETPHPLTAENIHALDRLGDQIDQAVERLRKEKDWGSAEVPLIQEMERLKQKIHQEAHAASPSGSITAGQGGSATLSPEVEKGLSELLRRHELVEKANKLDWQQIANGSAPASEIEGVQKLTRELEKQGGDVGQEAGRYAKEFDREMKRLKNPPQPYPQETASPKNNAQAPSPEAQGRVASSPAPIKNPEAALAPQATTAPQVASSATLPTSMPARKTPQPDFKSIEKFFLQLLKVLKWAFVIAVVAWAWLQIAKLLDRNPDSRGKPKKPNRIPATGVAVFRKMDFSKLAPHQEVVFRYHAFLEEMELRDLPKESHASPSLYCRRLSQKFPKAETELKVFTEIFSNVFYGQHEVSSKHLEAYRKAFDRLVNIS